MYGEDFIAVYVPKRIVDEIRRRSLDVESFIVDSIVRELKLDPSVEFEVHVELARRFLEEGKALVDKDPVQASEKLYKAAEEAIKALVIKHGITEIIDRVRERDRWKTEDFFDAINVLNNIYGDDTRRWWSTAWTLHVWGFHEAKATREFVKASIQDIEQLVKLTSKT